MEEFFLIMLGLVSCLTGLAVPVWVIYLTVRVRRLEKYNAELEKILAERLPGALAASGSSLSAVVSDGAVAEQQSQSQSEIEDVEPEPDVPAPEVVEHTEVPEHPFKDMFEKTALDSNGAAGQGVQATSGEPEQIASAPVEAVSSTVSAKLVQEATVSEPSAKVPVAQPAKDNNQRLSQGTSRARTDLTHFVLGNIFSFLGAVAILVAVGVFLDNIAEYLTPPVKMTLGYIASLVALYFGIKLNSDQRLGTYAGVLQGLGMGIALTTTYCSCTLLAVMSNGVAIVLACAIMLGTYFLSWNYHRTYMALLGVIAGYINLAIFDDISLGFFTVYLLFLNFINTAVLLRSNVFFLFGDGNLFFSLLLLVFWYDGNVTMSDVAWEPCLYLAIAILWAMHLIADGWRRHTTPSTVSLTSYFLAHVVVGVTMMACFEINEWQHPWTFSGCVVVLIPFVVVYGLLSWLHGSSCCLRRDYLNIAVLLGWGIMACLAAMWADDYDISVLQTMCWLVYAVVLILGGVLKHRNNLLVIGVLSMFATLWRAFLVDLAGLSTISKVICFMIVGGAMLALSYWYSRRSSVAIAEEASN